MQTTALLDTTFGRPLSLSRFSENFSLSRTGSGGDITAATVQLERSELEASSTYAAVDPPSPEALERSPRIRAAGDDAEHLAQTLDTSATFFLSEGTGTRSELPTAPPSPLAGALRPGFQKRLRLDDGSGSILAAPPLNPYSSANYLLRELHAEQLARKQAYDARRMDASQAVHVPSVREAAQGDMLAMTSFALHDVVQCNHGAGGRCLHCCGRHVQNVPLPLYSVYCAACRSTSVASSSSSSSLSAFTASAAQDDGELSFAAFAALAAALLPEPNERLLHLNSGRGRLVLVWALLLPHAAACGVESRSHLHQVAVRTAGELDRETSQRMFLHQGDIMETRGEWNQAGIIILTTDGMSPGALEQVVDGLQVCSPGARVVSLGQPLVQEPLKTPAGFEFARETPYKRASAGNCMAFIYRRVAATPPTPELGTEAWRA